jgi:hypothetical protein
MTLTLGFIKVLQWFRRYWGCQTWLLHTGLVLKKYHGPQVIWSAWRICRDDPTVPQLSLPILEIHWTPLHCRPRSRVPGEAGKCGQELTACAHTTASLPKVLLSVTGIFVLYTIMCSFWQWARKLLWKRLYGISCQRCWCREDNGTSNQGEWLFGRSESIQQNLLYATLPFCLLATHFSALTG